MKGGRKSVHYSVKTAALCGVEAYPIDAEVDISPAAADNGASMFLMVGLPDAAVRESRQRAGAPSRSCHRSRDGCGRVESRK